jgi:hypothetical protein
MRTDNGGQKKSGRIAIPLLDGAFNSPSDIRSRAQEFFLSIVMTETPAPLFSLRDDVLPKYLDAFKFERERGVNASDISRLAVHAVVNLLWINRLRNTAVPNEVQTARRDHLLIYRAGTAMILWCERFSLKARNGVAGSSDDSSSEDESWPVIAALQTIFSGVFIPLDTFGWAALRQSGARLYSCSSHLFRMVRSSCRRFSSARSPLIRSRAR